VKVDGTPNSEIPSSGRFLQTHTDPEEALLTTKAGT